MLTINTKRLILRPMEIKDFEGIYKLDSDPKVMKYLGGCKIKGKEEAKKVISLVQKQYAEVGVGRWTVIERKSGAFVGWSGLKYYTNEVCGLKNFYEIGYRLLPAFWGKGYATESAQASLKYGFKTLGCKVLYSMADIENTASLKVLDKLNFKTIGILNYEGKAHFFLDLKKEN